MPSVSTIVFVAFFLAGCTVVVNSKVQAAVPIDKAKESARISNVDGSSAGIAWINSPERISALYFAQTNKRVSAEQMLQHGEYFAKGVRNMPSLCQMSKLRGMACLYWQTKDPVVKEQAIREFGQLYEIDIQEMRNARVFALSGVRLDNYRSDTSSYSVSYDAPRGGIAAGELCWKADPKDVNETCVALDNEADLKSVTFQVNNPDGFRRSYQNKDIVALLRMEIKEPFSERIYDRKFVSAHVVWMRITDIILLDRQNRIVASVPVPITTSAYDAAQKRRLCSRNPLVFLY